MSALLSPRRERRRYREPIIRVWDLLVRIGHWLMVVFFAVIYLRYRKFPLHPYAGYLMLLLVFVRIGWGIAGSASARFRAFWFSPREVIGYARDAVSGRAAYYLSHNPLGACMVYFLLTMMLVNGTLGVLLYSAGQGLGPLAQSVPESWEDGLKYAHKIIGHLTAAAVAVHMAGVMWAALSHRQNYVLSMITGLKRAPRHALPATLEPYARSPVEIPNPTLRRMEEWFSWRHPVMGSLLLIVALVLVVLEIAEAAAHLNKYLAFY